MKALFAPLMLAQTTGPGGMPMWIILLIAFLLIVLILWAVTKPTAEQNNGPEEAVGRDDQGGNDGTEIDTAVSEAESVANPVTPDDLSRDEGT